MTELLNLELTSVLLTLLAYQAGAWLQKRTKSPVCNPILVGVVLVLAFMALTGLENQTYQGANVRLSWLMTPATISLAIPMYFRSCLSISAFPAMVCRIRSFPSNSIISRQAIACSASAGLKKPF